MTGEVLELTDVITVDNLGSRIANHWVSWDNARHDRKQQWKEVRQYVYATDTRQTSNQNLPWKNSTVIPKLCQIRDNLFANYMAALFPKRRWLTWEAANEKDAHKDKVQAIEDYMQHVVEAGNFRAVVERLVLDYIDYGVCFAYSDWVDNRTIEAGDEEDKVGYNGPVARRINPLDIVFNPIAPSIADAPKIVRSYVTLGELRGLLESLAPRDNLEEVEEIYKYLMDVRATVGASASDLSIKDDFFSVDGFGSFREYLLGSYVEVLTYYGDMLNYETGEFMKNAVITVVDRHKVVGKRTNKSKINTPTIYSSGWRKRQDNLWSMGPLDNLLGLQYRLNHVENLKADVFDLIAFPPLKIKGYVQDFNWAPMEHIFVGDDGDVSMLVPEANVLNADLEIARLQDTMEEMAGAPKQAMGFRTPGEKTAFEVQRLENAGSRIYHNKVAQIEAEVIEGLLNDMLQDATRMLDGATSIRVMNEENVSIFRSLTRTDISGQGTLKPVAARNFSEKAERIQNLSNFFQSGVGQDPEVMNHYSPLRIAKMIEELLDLEEFDLVEQDVRILERQQSTDLSNVSQQQSLEVAETPSGLTPGDIDEDL